MQCRHNGKDDDCRHQCQGNGPNMEGRKHDHLLGPGAFGSASSNTTACRRHKLYRSCAGVLRVLARQPDVAVRQKLQLQCCGTVRRHNAARVPPSSPTAREARPILPPAARPARGRQRGGRAAAAMTHDSLPVRSEGPENKHFAILDIL